jgi:acyl transferase domain-containing protein/acyl carrier protein
MTPASLLDTLRGTLARRLGRPAEELDPDTRFRALGADSLKVTAWLAEAGAALGRPLSPLLAWQHPTLAALAAHLAESPADPAAAPRAATLRAADGPVAVIGTACRFPGGATSPEGLWRLLAEGVDAIAEVPPARWPLGLWYDADPDAPGRMRTRWGGFLPDVAGFDAGFFGISPREAAQMDPQQRLLLELAVEALGDAAIAPGRLQGSRTGVFAGIIWQDWAQLLARAGARHIDAYSATGAHHSIAANRISYALGLTGPSLAVDTACSSSLVAVHLAAEALRRGECDLALAGGVNLMLAPDGTVAMSKFGAMAPDGRCKAFDARADGYVRGEGAGLVVLKPLAAAEAAGDRILAVLRGGAVNNDGPSNGLTAPNPAAQEAVLTEALARAGLPPAALDAVEAHGTGTLLGDPIEARALGAVLGRGRPADRPLLVGSIKTNIGHTEAAAGIAGLIKAVLMLRHRATPPSLHFRDPNPMIPFAELGLAVPARLTPLAREGKLRIGVSSFGFGGTNAHLILESAPEPPPVPAPEAAPPRRVALVFSGQGGQWTGMGRVLLAHAPLFRAAFLRADRAVRAEAGFSPLEEIARPEGEGLASIDRIQPTLFAWQVAMAAMLAGLGLRPAAVLGHSVGEVAAAVAAGALTLRAGARVVAARSALMRRTAGQGAMLAVQLGAVEAEAALAELPAEEAALVSLAAENAPGATVLSGAPAVLQGIAARLATRGVECGFIRVDVASHSPQMAPLLPELAARLDGLVPLPAAIPFLSAVRAAPVPGEALDAAYWCDNLRQPVRFAAVAAALAGCDAVVEVGPHPVLSGALERTLPDLPVLPAARREGEELATLAATAARLGLDPLRGEAAPAAPRLLPLSARDAAALEPLAEAVAGRLADQPLDALAGLAAERQDHAEHRLAVLAAAAEGAEAALRDPARRIAGRKPPAGPPGLILVFSGQATAWAGMGAGLEAEPEARDTLREAAAILARRAGWSLDSALTIAPSDPAVAQPAQVALQVALARQVLAWGFRPRAVIGHSLGEVSAACLAGVLTLEEALRLALHRGAAMRPLAGQGAMAALALPAEEVRRRLAGHPEVALAALNAPSRTVVAGPPAALEAFLATLPPEAAPRRLETDLAFHHPMTAPAREALEAALHGLLPRPAAVPLVSTVTGAPLAGEAMGAMHWGANLRHPVRFAEALRAAGPGLFLEIGPHPSLGGAVAETLPEATPLATLRRSRPAAPALREAAARLWAAGHDPDWAMLAPPWAPARTEARLPPYPWQRRRHWLPAPEAAPAAAAPAHPLLGTRLDSAIGPVLFGGEVAAEAPAWIADHVLHGAVVVPAVAYLETLLAAAAALGRGGAALTDIAFPEALVLEPGERRAFQTVAEGDRLRLFHRAAAGGAWRLCAEARMAQADPSPLPAATPAAQMPGAEFYAGFALRGGGLGPAFRVLGPVRHAPGAASATIALPPEARDGGPWRLHPVLLDSLLQLPNLAPALDGSGPLYVPVSIGALRLDPAAGPPVRAELRWDAHAPAEAETLRCEGALLDADGAVVARLSGFVARRARPDAFSGGAIPFRAPAFVPLELPEAAATEAEIHDARALPEDADLAEACAALATRFAALPTGRRLWLVTRDGGDPLSLAMQGCGRALALERPAAWGGMVEATPATPEAMLARAAALPGAPELRLGPAGAARRTLVPATPPAGVAQLSGAWLVTGASGALGLVAAEELAAAGATALVLLARRRPDPASPRLAALAARGVRLLPLAMDLAEPGAASRVLASAEAELGVLEGVLHAAGETADALAADLTAGHLRRALAAKLDAARELAAARRPGTRLVLFGSLAGLLGAAGQAAYAAANAALAAIPDAVLIGWPAWRGQGMAARGSSAWQGREVGMIEEAQGRRLLRALLAAPPGAWWPMPEGSATAAEEGALARRLLALAPRARRAAAEEAIGRMVAELLGPEPGTLPDPRRGFFDLGMDSLLVVRLRNRLQSELGVVLPQGVVFDHPNLAALAGFALEALPSEAPPPAAAPTEAAPGDLVAALEAELARLGH